MPERPQSDDASQLESEWMPIELVYAKSDEQVLIALKIAKGSTVADAIQASGLLTLCPDIDLTVHRTGIFGREILPNHPLKPHDRIEIYRPLTRDPKAARRIRAAKH